MTVLNALGKTTYAYATKCVQFESGLEFEPGRKLI